MHLRHLRLRNWRSYRDLSLTCRPCCNVLLGPNGAGKTNVLEAIAFLATARSHRGARDQELVSWGQADFAVCATVARKPVDAEVEVAWSQQRGKTVRVGGKTEARLSALVGRFNAVLFAPEDLTLLKGPPAARRRFLDVDLAQSSAAYFHHLQEFHRALAHRNALLRDQAPGPALRALLEAYDRPLAHHGAEVTQRRAAAVREIAPRAARHHAVLSEDAERLELRYQTTAHPDLGGEPGLLPLDAPLSARELEAALLARLASLRRHEERRQTTLVGPHRDDLEVRIDGREARLFASQGQQRSAVLALKLAELEAVAAAVGEEPVLLLDDVTSELDERRRRSLLQAVARRPQTFITATGIDDLDPGWLEGADLWRVGGGSVHPLSA